MYFRIFIALLCAACVPFLVPYITHLTIAFAPRETGAFLVTGTVGMFYVWGLSLLIPFLFYKLYFSGSLFRTKYLIKHINSSRN